MAKRPIVRLCGLLLACALASAADWGALQPQGYVSDFAGVVDASSKQRIEAYAAAVEKSTGAQLAFVTIPRLDGEPVEDVANLLYRKWGIGKKGKDEGVLLLLSVEDRRSRLEVGYGLEPVLPDGAAGGLLREMRSALRVGRYGEAILVAARQIGQRIGQEKGVQIEEPGGSARRPAPEGEQELPWPMILIGLLLVLFLFSRGGGGPWWLLPMLMGGGRNGRGGGGGFGGYDSGGGFGGFGGGDSGGGGASSEW